MEQKYLIREIDSILIYAKRILKKTLRTPEDFIYASYQYNKSKQDINTVKFITK